MLLVGWIVALSSFIGIVIVIIMAVWVTGIWSPASWKAEARMQRVLRGEPDGDETNQ